MNDKTKKDFNKFLIRLIEQEYVYQIWRKDISLINKKVPERPEKKYLQFLKPVSFWQELKQMVLKLK